jgi:DNA replication licensing factor MCM7
VAAFFSPPPPRPSLKLTPSVVVAAAVEEFLTHFKSAPEEIATALGNVTISDDLFDDLDAMDEDGGTPASATRAGRRRGGQKKSKAPAPRQKYVDMMQSLADRKIDEVVVDLDDVAAVRMGRGRGRRGTTCVLPRG